MKPRVTVITLGVDDLAGAVAFYRDGLGLATEGIVGEEFEHGAVAFFGLRGGVRLALWPRESISHDSGTASDVEERDGVHSRSQCLDRGEVDRVMEEARRAGAGIVKPAAKTFLHTRCIASKWAELAGVDGGATCTRPMMGAAAGRDWPGESRNRAARSFSSAAMARLLVPLVL